VIVVEYSRKFGIFIYYKYIDVFVVSRVLESVGGSTGLRPLGVFQIFLSLEFFYLKHPQKILAFSNKTQGEDIFSGLSERGE